MAETLTVDTTPQTETVGDSLTTDEQESLAIGEEMESQQEQLLAGKYKDAAELEKAYIELQSKLGEANKETPEEVTEETTEEAEPEPKDVTDTEFLDRLWDEATGDKYTDDTLKELSEMSARDLAQMHLEYRSKNQQAQPKELTPENITKLKGVAGGDEGYDKMIGWAKGSLAEQEIAMFDKVMESGDTLACYFAIQALKYRYDDASGVEGTMLTGKAPSSRGTQFKSNAQLVEAMNDPKYDNDPAYRQEVMEKLERSNLKF